MARTKGFILINHINIYILYIDKTYYMNLKGIHLKYNIAWSFKVKRDVGYCKNTGEQGQMHEGEAQGALF